MLDALRERTRRLAMVLSWPVVVLVLGSGIWTASHPAQPFGWSTVPPVLASIVAALFLRARREGRAFAGTAITIGFVVLSRPDERKTDVHGRR